jgi:hypothetical protein
MLHGDHVFTSTYSEWYFYRRHLWWIKGPEVLGNHMWKLLQSIRPSWKHSQLLRTRKVRLFKNLSVDMHRPVCSDTRLAKIVSEYISRPPFRASTVSAASQRIPSMPGVRPVGSAALAMGSVLLPMVTARLDGMNNQCRLSSLLLTSLQQEGLQYGTCR